SQYCVLCYTINYSLSIYIFFFQAEDGIRDRNVTGVQTCALPILWDELNSRSTGDGKLLGQTMYFGSQTSDIFCRIYDKALEQKRKVKDKDKEIPEKWTRMEIVYRKERAKMLALHMIECSNVGLVIRRTLQQYIRFVQRPKNSKDSNKSRWKTAKWWERLLENVEPLKLTVKRQDK